MKKNRYMVSGIIMLMLIFAGFCRYTGTFYNVFKGYAQQVYNVLGTKFGVKARAEQTMSADKNDEGKTIVKENDENNSMTDSNADKEETDSFVKNFIHVTEEALNEDFLCKYKYIEINGIFEMLARRKQVKDSTYTIVKLDNGNLHFYYQKNNVDRSESIQNICNLSEYCKEKGTHFLYVQASDNLEKNNNTLPYELEDNINPVVDKVLESLRDGDVDCMDLREVGDGIIDYDTAFFKTDHHWTPSTAFWAFGEICKRLNQDYGFNIDNYVYDIDNYNTTMFEGVMLGSAGKRVGKYYSGVEEIELISPKFETNYSYIIRRPDKEDKIRIGTYNDTVIFKDMLEGSLYDTAVYNIYMGGDYYLSTIENHLNNDDKRVLFIRDSYGQPVTAFMSTAVKYLDIIDPRKYNENLYEYIEETKPNAVIYLCYPWDAGSKKMTNFGKRP